MFTLAIPGIESVSPRILAHLGDGVYELWLRQLMIRQVSEGHLTKVETTHRWLIKRANATFQAQLLHILLPQLTEEENQILKRARNSPVSVSRRSNQAIHRQATAFEALVGYWYGSDQPRLQAVLSILEPVVIAGESKDLTP